MTAHQNKVLGSNRAALSLLMPVLTGSLVGLVVLAQVSINSESEKKLDELALGEETSSYFARVDDYSIHCHDYDDSLQCLDSYKKSSRDDVVLMLGNSQTHSINQMKPGDETAAPILHRSLRDRQKYFMTFSQGNANLQEHYVLFEYLSGQVPVSTLVLPVVFDDMRETGIRATINGAFKQSFVIGRLDKTEIGISLLANQGEQDLSGNDMTALDDTVQEYSERYLNTQLESAWGIWADRPELRGELFFSLYIFRNWLFDITPSSIRKMIPGRYAMNLQALQAILESANKQGVKVLLYIVPLRNDVKIPYDVAQYQSFKNEIKMIAKNNEARFVNMENLVPTGFWGTKGSTSISGSQELDFMHFQADGHKLLADALLKEWMLLWDGEKVQ